MPPSNSMRWCGWREREVITSHNTALLQALSSKAAGSEIPPPGSNSSCKYSMFHSKCHVSRSSRFACCLLMPHFWIHAPFQSWFLRHLIGTLDIIQIVSYQAFLVWFWLLFAAPPSCQNQKNDMSNNCCSGRLESSNLSQIEEGKQGTETQKTNTTGHLPLLSDPSLNAKHWQTRAEGRRGKHGGRGQKIKP